MNVKIAKLDDQFASEAAENPFKKSNLFAGIKQTQMPMKLNEL